MITIASPIKSVLLTIARRPHWLEGNIKEELVKVHRLAFPLLYHIIRIWKIYYRGEEVCYNIIWLSYYDTKVKICTRSKGQNTQAKIGTRYTVESSLVELTAYSLVHVYQTIIFKHVRTRHHRHWVTVDDVVSNINSPVCKVEESRPNILLP